MVFLMNGGQTAFLLSNGADRENDDPVIKIKRVKKYV